MRGARARTMPARTWYARRGETEDAGAGLLPGADAGTSFRAAMVEVCRRLRMDSRHERHTVLPLLTEKPGPHQKAHWEASISIFCTYVKVRLPASHYSDSHSSLRTALSAPSDRLKGACLNLRGRRFLIKIEAIAGKLKPR